MKMHRVIVLMLAVLGARVNRGQGAGEAEYRGKAMAPQSMFAPLSVVQAVLAVLVFGFLQPAAAASFNVIDLTPEGFVSSQAVGVSEGQQVGFGLATGGADHALLWVGSASSAVDLHPSGFTMSRALGVSGGVQVGSGMVQETGATHALLWTGSAASAVDLNPTGFDFSQALGVSGGAQVGSGGGPSTGFLPHALLWTDSAASAVDLNPAGFFSSEARAVSDGQQVGVGNFTRALLWTGSAASAVDLTPFQFTSAEAFGVSSGQQVGFGTSPLGDNHALLWTGSADSVVDLHPSGFLSSRALGVSGGQQVGFGIVPLVGAHALLWEGSAASVVDLHSFLPPGFTESVAVGIDDDGNVVGFARGPASSMFDHAILWQPVPVAIAVAIDIKPGSFPNSINPKSQGKISVAILSTPTFDAPVVVDKTSLRFGRTGDETSLAFCNRSSEDVNGDGLLDLVCHFTTQLTGFHSGDTNGTLIGQTVGGVAIIGSDSVLIVPTR